MRQIKNDFIEKITQSAKISVGTSVVLNFGINNHQQYALSYPDATIHIGAGPPDVDGVRKIMFSPTHQQIQSFLTNNRNILFELYLTEIIQYYFEFLGNLYKKAIIDNISGNSSYPISPQKTTVDFTLSETDFNNSIISSACIDFDFLPASKKFSLVRNIFEVESSDIESELALIKTNIQVRNILQHHKGVVKAKDLEQLGVQSIIEDHGNEIKHIAANERITRTGFDIENLVNALIKVSHTLIP